MFSDISEVLEDFRLYCLSYWSDLYLIQNYLSPSNLISVASECLERKWLILSRQTMFVQIYVIVTVLSLLSLLTVKIWVMLTTGRCRSKARLDGKTVLVTGANVGKDIRAEDQTF